MKPLSSRVRKAIRNLVKAEIENSWKGLYDIETRCEIERNLYKARKRLDELLPNIKEVNEHGELVL